jgi:protein-L-isoaspartate(D-aspartate) O-methyltransferase
MPGTINMINNQQAKTNMLTQQIRAVGVLDDFILQIIASTPRELFVPTEYREFAFADMNIPLGHEQVMLAPDEEGRILQALQIQPHETVLEIGTGSGYMTTLLAKMAKHVESVDYYAEFTQSAQKKIVAMGLDNIHLVTADAAEEYATSSNYDVVVITGALPFLPEAYKKLIKLEGRLLSIVGQAPAMEAVLMTRRANTWEEKTLFETVVPYLVHAKRPSAFTF